MDHRRNFSQFFKGHMAKDTMAIAGIAPGGDFYFANMAAVGQQIPARAAGMEAASIGWIKGARHVPLQPYSFLFSRGIGDRHRR